MNHSHLKTDIEHYQKRCFIFTCMYNLMIHKYSTVLIVCDTKLNLPHNFVLGKCNNVLVGIF